MPERKAFLKLVTEQGHGCINPCFMTGKGCVYSDSLDFSRFQKQKKPENERGWSGFVIMPFRPNLGVVLDNCIKPFFMKKFGPRNGDSEDRFELDRADDVRSPGIIICEGICKRIQSADFVIADITISNDNVLYELGLSYGIGHKTFVIHQALAEAEKRDLIQDVITVLEEGDCHVFSYKNLLEFSAQDFQASHLCWRDPDFDATQATTIPNTIYIEIMNPNEKDLEPHNDGDIQLPFNEHVISHVQVAMDNIYHNLYKKNSETPSAIIAYKDLIGSLLKVKSCIGMGKFIDMKRNIDNAYCIIMRTGQGCHPITYFWLGYAHAKGKNVIPITVAPSGDIEREPVKDLAFDIRAQRHMVFEPKEPLLLQKHLRRTLQEMIVKDFSEWSRKSLWSTLLGKRGKVSIFTGALHNEELRREMVGDWDLRAASALTLYFSGHQYTPKIETPIYPPENSGFKTDGCLEYAEYIKRILTDMKIAEKTCIIIASPDVNPLTEIVLGKLYDVPEKILFSKANLPDINPKSIVAVKGSTKRNGDSNDAGKENQPPVERVFYAEYGRSEQYDEKRGFNSKQFISSQVPMAKYYSQTATAVPDFDIYAHLVIARNPYAQGAKQYVIILNGVSGPATFALTQVLTGGGDDEEDPERHEADSEKILRKLVKHVQDPNFRALDCILKVTIKGSEKSESAPKPVFDWRRVDRWELATELFDDGVRTFQFKAAPQPDGA